MLAERPGPRSTDWGIGLLHLAALVAVPLATGLLLRTSPFSMSSILKKLQSLQLPSAIVLLFSFFLKKGWLAAVLALPWAGVLLAMALAGALQLWRSRWSNAPLFCMAAGLAYLSVAAVWLLLERAGLAPLGFNPDIVFLTIVHFHYAGFVLPLLAGLSANKQGKRIVGQIICYFSVAAVGLLALGITITQLGLGTDWEMASAWWMAATAGAVAMLHIRLAFLENTSLKVKLLWLAAAASLLGAMLLAGLYGSRFIAPVAWLDIPTMRALHGSLNAVGFALCALLGWSVKLQERL
jgi:hypothetical protein